MRKTAIPPALPCTLLLIAMLSSAAIATPVTLKEGNPVVVRVDIALRSGREKAGSDVPFRVYEDVLGPNKEVLIAAGTLAKGAVTASKKRGILGKRGRLEFTCDFTEGVDGTKVVLRGTPGGGGKSNVTGAVVGALLLAWPLLFVSGRDVIIEKGQRFTVFVDKEAVIDPAKHKSQQQTPLTPTIPAQAGARSLISLKNGDKITGVVRGLQEGVYTIETTGGALSIPQDQVLSIVPAEEPAAPAAESVKPAESQPPPSPPATEEPAAPPAQ